MVKILFYGISVFMELFTGIWIFGQIFPKRTQMQVRHCLSEWMLFSLLMLEAYVLPTSLFPSNHPEQYRNVLILTWIVLSLCYLVFCLVRCRNGFLRPTILSYILGVCMVSFITRQYWNAFLTPSLISLGNILPVFFLYVLFRCSFVQAYVWAFLYLVNIGILKAAYMAYTEVFHDKTTAFFYQAERVHSYSEILYLLLICFFLLAAAKKFSVPRFLKELMIKKTAALFLFANGELFLLTRILRLGKRLQKGRSSPYTLFFSVIYVFAVLFIIVFLYVKSWKETTEEEKQELSRRNVIIEQQYQAIRETYEKYRCLVHDEKQLISYLQGCLQNGEIQVALKCLQNREQTVAGRQTFFFTAISSLNILLNIKYRSMQEHRIRFECRCLADTLPMGDADFIVMLGNLLDNATEAAMQCPRENRKIVLYVQNINDSFLVQIGNTMKNPPSMENRKFLTSKRDQNEHGWGTESIKRMVKKYGGVVDFTCEEGLFTVSILL